MPCANWFCWMASKQIPIDQELKNWLDVLSNPNGSTPPHRRLPVQICRSPHLHHQENFSLSKVGTGAFVLWAFSTVAMTRAFCSRRGYHTTQTNPRLLIICWLSDVHWCPWEELPPEVKTYHGSNWIKLMIEGCFSHHPLSLWSFMFWGPSAPCMPRLSSLTATWWWTPIVVTKLQVSWVVRWWYQIMELK